MTTIPGLSDLPVDHIGFACSDLRGEISRYRDLMGGELVSQEEIASQGVAVAFLRTQNTLIELLAPVKAESTLSAFLTKRGPGLHHICYRVPDLRDYLAHLSSRGVVLIDSVPRPGAHNTMIAFAHPKSFGGVLTEFCEHLPA